MLYVYLALTGGPVIFPDGHAIVDEEGGLNVRVVNAEGKVLAIFRRRDVNLYSRQVLQEGAGD